VENLCERTCKCEDILYKHQKIAHENLKLYCHYFDHLKSCPFKEECVFLHKVFKECQFGIECKRKMCLFRHGAANEIIKKNVETADASGILDVGEEDETNCENQISTRTFNSPSQTDKTDKLLIKCETCDFSSAMTSIIENHITS
jgi:hypothetical protein